MCHKLNGTEYGYHPAAWLAHASNPFDAGNLCTARRLAGDEALFAELRSVQEKFHAETDGDPHASVEFRRPQKAQLRTKLACWVQKAHHEAEGMSRSLAKGVPHDPSRVWKEALQVGIVSIQALAVLHRLEALNTFDRLDLATARGLVETDMGARVHHPHRALEPRAPKVTDQPKTRPHELRIARVRDG